MQPLQASLDFLLMRLSMFQARAETIFPTACDELEEKRTRLEKGWKKLEQEAEDLRSELGEDRWILVFRNAGRQAQKMCESDKRSITKLQEALDAGQLLKIHLLLPRKSKVSKPNACIMDQPLIVSWPLFRKVSEIDLRSTERSCDCMLI